MIKRKALIVDDEYAAREMLKGMVDWDALDYEPPVLSTNGAEALQLLGTGAFDIVITDIEMPIMDGIDLIVSTRKIKPDQRFIIISCHESFEYAQRALRLGVEDYIIKDLVTDNELKTLLCSVALPAASGESVDNGLAEPRLEELLRRAVGGEVPANATLEERFAAVYLVSIDEYERLVFERGATAVKEMIDAFVARVGAHAVYVSGGGFVYILSKSPETNSILYYINDAITCANAIRALAHRLQLGPTTIGVSDPVSTADALPEACQQAREAVDMRVIEGFDKTILYGNISMKKQMVNHNQINHLLKRVEELASNANATCVKYVDRLYTADRTNGFADVHYFRYVNIRMWALLTGRAQAKGFSQLEILKEIGLNLDAINRMENSAMMAQFFKGALLKLISDEANAGTESIVSAALSLIEREYTNDISLTWLAEQLHTHKSYLCRVFKEQMGQNLMPYIENKRIDRAKYLLRNSQMKLWEISDSLGFTSQQYFSFVFKKIAKMSPTDFRKESEMGNV